MSIQVKVKAKVNEQVVCSGSGEVNVKVNEQANVNVKDKVQDQGRHMCMMWLR